MDLSSVEGGCAVAARDDAAPAAARARSESGITTSSVTARAKQRDDAPIFRRGLTLATSAARLHEFASPALSQPGRTRGPVPRMQPLRPAGRLRIGAMESTAAARLPALLSGYHRRWPEVRIELTIGTSRSLTEDVLGGRVDCAFIAGSGQELARRALVATRAYSEELLLVLPRNHPPARAPGDIRLSSLAAFADGCAYRGVLEHWLEAGECRARGWEVIEQGSYHSLLACVAAGACFALCPRSVLQQQRVPLDIRTHYVATIDTCLVARAAFGGAAYDELLRSIAPGRLRAVDQAMSLNG